MTLAQANSIKYSEAAKISFAASFVIDVINVAGGVRHNITGSVGLALNVSGGLLLCLGIMKSWLSRRSSRDEIEQMSESRAINKNEND